MTRHYCTLLDSAYLTRGLALHTSLVRHGGDCHLTVFCFDELAAQTLDELALPHLSVVTLGELEKANPGLRAVKPTRTRAEYCWTATPSLPLHMFNRRPELQNVTYLDADVLFFADPAPVFDEMGDASVAITPHRYAQPYLHHQVSGVYNVQFLTFRNDVRAREVLQWWDERCLEWCYDRLEGARYGDQKYLDHWPEQFPGIHVVQHPGAGLAPWNASRYDLRQVDGQVTVDGRPLIFFHFHGLRLRASGRHRLAPPGYLIPPATRRLIYEPYLDSLGHAKDTVRSVNPGFAWGVDPPAGWAQQARDARVAATERIVQRVPRLGRLRAWLSSVAKSSGVA
jgi:hypothetical protein